MTRFYHGAGVYAPNEGDVEVDRIIELIGAGGGDGSVVLMHHQAGRKTRGKPAVQLIREALPLALIQIRCYVPNWYALDPRAHAEWCADQMTPFLPWTDHVTWANEQNLAAESGGVVGATPGRLATWDDYRRIHDWNMRVLDRWDELRVPFVRHYPALAYGHGEDWGYDEHHQPLPGFPLKPSGEPVPAYELLRPGIDRCHILNTHPYVQPGADPMDEWVGVRRVEKVAALFPGKTLFADETGDFGVSSPQAPDRIVRIAYYLQSRPEMLGYCFFILNTPDRGHDANNWTRNPAIEARFEGMTRVPRPRAWTEPSPAQAPQPVPAPKNATQEHAMRLGLLYRMGSDVPEASINELADLCARGGFSAISPKAMDGNTWEGAFDGNDPLGLTGADALQVQVLSYARRGLSVEPWVVYRGFDAGAEATAHATVGRICRTVIVDFEWRYPSFADKGTWDDAVRYFRLLREGAPSVRIVFCPDPRQVRNGDYPVADVLPFVDVVSPQVYWTDFQQPWGLVLDDGLSADYGGRDVWPMLPGNSDPGDLDAALTRLENEWHSAKPPTAYVFQRVGLREENLPILAKHAQLGGGPVAAPEPAENPQEEPLLTIDKDAYERDYWAPSYALLQQAQAVAASSKTMVEKLRASGHHADGLLADALEKAAGQIEGAADVLRPTVSLHKVVCGAEAA